MKGLIDLLPEDVDISLKKEYARKLYNSKHNNYKPQKNELKNYIRWDNNSKKRNSEKNSLNNYEDSSNATHKIKIKYIRLKKSAIMASQRNRLKKISTNEDAKRRALAKNGIVVYSHVFMNNGSFYGGRRRSLEWNDEIARHAKVGIRSLNKIKKRKKR